MKTLKEMADYVVERGTASDKTLQQHRWIVEKLKPIGHLDIAKLGAPDLFRLLETLGESSQTARRVKMLVGRCLRLAIATGARRERDFTPDLRGVLKRATAVKPRAAILDQTALGSLLQAIDSLPLSSPISRALRLAPLVFVRPGELRSMRWEHVDLEAKTWVLPAECTKMRREHVVPLSNQAVDLLWLDCEPAETGFVFPGRARPGGGEACISENVMTIALRRLGYERDEVSVHGFRATASTLLREEGMWDNDLIELQLAHRVGNGTRRAYDRAMRIEQRREMMQWWANYLDSLKDGEQMKEAA